MIPWFHVATLCAALSRPATVVTSMSGNVRLLARAFAARVL